jgi:2-keto-myo-inositol isomerase
LNSSTIRRWDGTQGIPRPIDEQIKIAASAGYDAIEPWIPDLRQFQESGGKLDDLQKQIVDSGLTVESAIGFANWIVDDPVQRAAGLESAKRDMDMLAAIGGKRIAAPPAGATNQADLNLLAAAERYRKLLEAGADIGVIPQLELWGFSKSLKRLGELMFVAIESGHPDACLLPDVYHVYKGGSDIAGLRLINGAAIHCLHVNDYPSAPPRETIGDADRVYPGDGIAPLSEVISYLQDSAPRCVLSLELFNPHYWQQDPLDVAKTGLRKMRDAVSAALKQP